MGTSSMYGGPTDKNPLLPDDFEDEAIDPKQMDEKNKMLWKSAKHNMTNYVKGKDSGSPQKVMRSYYRAGGRASKLANTSSSGINAIASLGNLLKSVQSQGLTYTLDNLKVSWRGKSVQVVLSELVNVISPEAATKEDIVARKALIDTTSEIYKIMEKNNSDIDSLDALDDSMIEILLCNFISTYIFERILSDLGHSFEKHLDNTLKAKRLEKNLKDYIKSSIDSKLGDSRLANIDYEHPDVKDIITKVFQDCYYIFGGEE